MYTPSPPPKRSTNSLATIVSPPRIGTFVERENFYRADSACRCLCRDSEPIRCRAEWNRFIANEGSKTSKNDTVGLGRIETPGNTAHRGIPRYRLGKKRRRRWKELGHCVRGVRAKRITPFKSRRSSWNNGDSVKIVISRSKGKELATSLDEFMVWPRIHESLRILDTLRGDTSLGRDQPLVDGLV